MEDYDQPESKYGRIYKVAGPCKYKLITSFNSCVSNVLLVSGRC